jgi:uncharacterized protein YjbI with pentapeptide repeats
MTNNSELPPPEKLRSIISAETDDFVTLLKLAGLDPLHDLTGTDLAGTNLQGADLRGADLREADLRGADLRKADLRKADLREADLRKADLREADLREADLSWANLDGAIFDSNVIGDGTHYDARGLTSDRQSRIAQLIESPNDAEMQRVIADLRATTQLSAFSADELLIAFAKLNKAELLRAFEILSEAAGRGETLLPLNMQQMLQLNDATMPDKIKHK